MTTLRKMDSRGTAQTVGQLPATSLSVSDVKSAFVSVHYHRLDVGDNKQVTGEESDLDTASSPSSRGKRLNFHKMLT